MKTKILASVFIFAATINASAEAPSLEFDNNLGSTLEAPVDNSVSAAADTPIDSPASTQPVIVPDNRPVIKTYQTQNSTDAAGNTTTNTVITESPAPISDVPVTTTVTQGAYTKLIDAGGKYDASGDTYSPKIDFAK